MNSSRVRITRSYAHQPAGGGWRVDRRILAGITRELVVELCRNHELPLVEQEVPSERLYDADEIWLTSSSKDALPIVSLDGRPIGNGRPGALWKALARHFLEFKRAVCGIA